jgi:hypothetical protein
MVEEACDGLPNTPLPSDRGLCCWCLAAITHLFARVGVAVRRKRSGCCEVLLLRNDPLLPSAEKLGWRNQSIEIASHNLWMLVDHHGDSD